MEYNKYELDTYNIHTIKTDKFKTVRMEIIFSGDVVKEDMAPYSFLCDLLTDSSKKYMTRKSIAIRLEELYKTIFYGVTNKVGNVFLSSFVTEFIDPKYINEPNYLENVLSFPLEIITNPRVTNEEFDMTSFNIVKKRMLKEVEAIKENPDKLAINKALSLMDENSPSSFRVLGTTEDILNLTTTNLYPYYEKLLNETNCDIFVIGNINNKEVVELIKKHFKRKNKQVNKLNFLVNNVVKNEVLQIKEESNFIQSTLVMIYNINNLDKDKLNIDFHVFNYLFGSGGINALLYKVLRTENSLCYALRSLYLKYDGLLVVEVSLDKENVDRAKKLIEKCLNDVIEGKFSDNDLLDAKKNLTLSLKMGLDSNVSLLNNYVFNYYDELPLILERVEKIKIVEKVDIINCAKALKLNTVYVQDAGDLHERN